MSQLPRVLALALLTVFSPPAIGWAWQDEGANPEPVSYSQQIRPVLAASCFGCHQGARQEGGYDMTRFANLLRGGDSGSAAIVPGAAEASYLLELVTPDAGEVQMPPADSHAEPLNQEQVDLLRRWISEGAENDELSAISVYTNESPPEYSRQPNITAIDFSPDGRWLAVNGFHEVLLFDTQNLKDGAVARRLIGLSARIESLQFSPDGTRLAACGGNPAEFGEIQIWDVASGQLQLSRIVSFDTVYGIDWSPDGKRVAFGCTDTTVRAIDADTGQQVFYQGAHDDWIRDTVFSLDGSQLVSVGRDMTCKLYEVGTQRFIDNITSITPGVLKGGIASVARHPQRDEIVIGGADGVPKVYRMNRLTKRVIGDDANLVRLLPALPGRIQSVAVSRDGKRIAAVSSLDGKGALRVFSYEFDPTVSEELKAVLAKQPAQWNAQERQLVTDYREADIKTLAAVDVPESGLYAVAFRPDGRQVVAAGSDGRLRCFDTETGSSVQQFLPVITTGEASRPDALDWRFQPTSPPSSPQPPAAVAWQGLQVSPASIRFQSPTEYVQLVIQGLPLDGSAALDLTHTAEITVAAHASGVQDPPVSLQGSLVQPRTNGTTELHVAYAGFTVSVPVVVDLPPIFQPEFRRDVNPILTKLGCNAGTCHGSADGKMGFKLSLRGYDPIFDLRAFTDDMGARRTNLASPDDSLMLAKPSAAVPHRGGKLLDPQDKYYQIIREWIRSGAALDLELPQVIGVELIPPNPVLPRAGDKQQMRLVATWSDGTTRDVTREGFIEVGGMETAQIVDDSSVQALRRGETPILARYEGAFTATTLTVMGDREGFTWTEPESWTPIDQLVADKWQRMQIQPAELCDDYEFVRRIFLDLTGLPPDSDQVEAFVADPRPTREKRNALIDDLIGSDAFVEHWSNKWADLLQVNRKYLGPAGAKAFRDWIREQVRNNRPYDQFVYDILTASGSNRENPAAAWYKIHRTPVDTMENTTHLFLATRFNCNKCHDHPFERWTQDQYFETAAFFAQVSLQADPASGDERIGGTAVEGAKPLYEIISDGDGGEITHDRTGETVAPAFPFDCDFQDDADAPRRARLAAWITAPDNPYFATSYANRLWGYLLGVGLIEPLDDIRAGNPPTNPQLLDYLTREFVDHEFDVQHLLRLICQSRTYQLSIATNRFNADDTLNYSHAMARRLPAEVLFDSIHYVTGSQPDIPGVAAGTRAAALPDSGARLPSGFLSTLGRPARESVCECERSSELQLGSVLALVSGPDVSRAIDDPASELARLVAEQPDDRQLIQAVYLRILNRPASDEEIALAQATFATLSADHAELVQQRDQRQARVDAQRGQREQERLQAMQHAEQELEAAIRERDPQLRHREATREQAIIDTKAALDEYARSPQGLAAWLNQQRSAVHWHTLPVSDFQSTVQRPFSVQEDRSVLLQAQPGRDIYTVLSHTDLTGVSAIRLELLPHASLAEGGPGLAKNGNVVLTEFEIEVARADQPDDWQPVKIQSALANFEQAGFPLAQVFDQQTTGGAGWALMGNLGKPNWATFLLQSPLGFAHGTRLRFRLHQQYDDTHQIGRFRISLSRDHRHGLGLAESLIAELTQPEDQREAEN